jgi:hypothetical protein
MFPLPDLLLDIIITKFLFASQVPTTYQALYLVSKASRNIELDHAFSSDAGFAQFISSHPEIAPRILAS